MKEKLLDCFPSSARRSPVSPLISGIFLNCCGDLYFLTFQSLGVASICSCCGFPDSAPSSRTRFVMLAFRQPQSAWALPIVPNLNNYQVPSFPTWSVDILPAEKAPVRCPLHSPARKYWKPCLCLQLLCSQDASSDNFPLTRYHFLLILHCHLTVLGETTFLLEMTEKTL